MRDFEYLSVADLKSVAKYYRIEHKSRIKRAELEALIFLAEVKNGLEVVEGYNAALELIQVGEEDGLPTFDVSGADIMDSSP